MAKKGRVRSTSQADETVPEGDDPLRQEAERRLATRPEPTGSGVADPESVHELRVHQVELEMQNAELARAHQEAEAARDHFAMLFDFAPVAYFHLDAKARIDELNLAGADLLGSPRAELVGDSLLRFVAVASRASFSDFLARLFDGDGAERALELVLVAADGKEVPVHVVASRSAEARQVLVAVNDRAEHGEAAVLRRERATDVAALAGLRAIATRRSTDDPSGLFDDIVATALAVTGARAGVLHLVERSTDNMVIAAQHGFEEDYLEHFGTIGLDRSCMCAVARRQRGRVTVEDLASPPAYLEPHDVAAMVAAGIRAAQSTPLVARTGAVLGVLSTQFSAPTPAGDQGLAAIDVLARLGADVLEQANLLRELRDVEARHRQFLDAVADPVIVVDRSGVIAYANDLAERAFGYGPGELVGRPHSDLVPESLRGVHTHEVEVYLRAPTMREMGSETRRRFRGRRKDGTEFPIEVALNPVQTASGPMISSVVRDVTERERLESAAALHTERLASAIETIPDVIAIWDRDDALVACNSAFCRLLEATAPEELVGLPADAIIQRATPRLGSGDAHLWFGRPGDDAAPPVDLLLRDGRRFRVSSRKKSSGGWVTTGIDLTEDLLREQELEIARARAEASSRAKDEFLASMSHELRTPLNAVLGFCQLLQRDRKDHLTDRQREMVDQVAKGGEHLLALIDDVLDLARIEAERVSITSEVVSVVDTVMEVVQTLEPLALRAGVTLHFDPSAPIPAVEADPRRFVQILMNLTSNAIKYNNRGGTVTFELSNPSPSVVRIAVVDTGRGIPAAQQPKLFTAFQRAGQEGGPIEGTGIGLVISRRLAELMNGSVGFVSRIGVGSSFWVDLPAHGTDSPRAPLASSTPLDAPETLRGLVVYVDDNSASLSLMRALVEGREGVELVTAITAEEGIARVRERRPDLVLMDINLPGMGGFEALAVLQADPATRGIPVVAVSAAATPMDRARGLQAGFVRYLTKPVRVGELEQVFRETLARRG